MRSVFCTPISSDHFPLPGECDDEKKPADDTIPVQKCSLDMKASFRSSEAEAQTPDEASSSSDNNAVEPFQLDDNFDYDNVTLTPKYLPKQNKEKT